MKLCNRIRTQNPPITLDRARRFLTDTCNLLKITPAWLDFGVVGGSGRRLYPGMIIAFHLKPEPS
jgi:hypothetical protein